MDSHPGLWPQTCWLGDYWRPDRDERSEFGVLVRRAKDCADEAAAGELAERFAGLAPMLGEAPDGSQRLVVAVPASPASAGCAGGLHLAERLARSLAAAAGWERGSSLVRRGPGPRLRDIEPGRRAEAAAAAGYHAQDPVAGRHVVVVDDVILTGVTVRAVAGCLRDAGAASVAAAVAVRTRLR